MKVPTIVPGSRLGIVVNPMSGRDVRRVAARASTSSHHEKQQQVTRLVLAALAQGVERVYLANEPFRINSRAVENLPQRDQVELLSFPLTHTAADTESMVSAMWQEGCRVFIVLGGDGTSRIVARGWPDAIIMPLSTGTNNVFPIFVEASVAGAAAGLVAAGKIDYQAHCKRCKQIHINSEARNDLALIDAVLLKNDALGSMLPFRTADIDTVVLSRAEPASVGVSPIGGYLRPCHHEDEHAVVVHCSPTATQHFPVPISPGLYQDIGIERHAQLALTDSVTVKGPGILAFDGDREIELLESDTATLCVRRDGPWIIEPAKVMREAALAGRLRGDHAPASHTLP